MRTIRQNVKADAFGQTLSARKQPRRGTFRAKHGQFSEIHGQFSEIHGQFSEIHGQFSEIHGEFSENQGQFSHEKQLGFVTYGGKNHTAPRSLDRRKHLRVSLSSVSNFCVSPSDGACTRKYRCHRVKKSASTEKQNTPLRHTPQTVAKTARGRRRPRSGILMATASKSNASTRLKQKIPPKVRRDFCQKPRFFFSVYLYISLKHRTLLKVSCS